MSSDNFEADNKDVIQAMAEDQEFKDLSRKWFDKSCEHQHSYHFTWMGRPVIQYPDDLLATQELIWKVKPELIIETGIARGGSLIFYASLLEMIGGQGRVLGIDIDIRDHNRVEIEAHPMFKRIDMIEGSSTDTAIAEQVKASANGKSPVMVLLDSNHTHEHVLEELNIYSDLVSVGSYLIVYDTVIEDMPEDAFPNRPWGRGNSPKTAVRQFLEVNPNFKVDQEVDMKLPISVAPEGYLIRTE